MEVKKVLVLGESKTNIVAMYDAKLLDSGVELRSATYRNCMEAFEEMIDSLANEAFQLGLKERGR